MLNNVAQTVLNGIELVSIFVQHLSTTFNVLNGIHDTTHWANLTPLMPVPILITRVISLLRVHFAVAKREGLLKYNFYMFQHSAKSLFDLWLFLLRWPHTPQDFLETSLPSRPLLLERTGQDRTTPGTLSPTLLE